MTLDDQKEVLSAVQEGDIFEFGGIFTTMAPDEVLVWQVMEVNDTEEHRRVVVRLSYFEIFIAQIVAFLMPDGSVSWSSKCLK